MWTNGITWKRCDRLSRPYQGRGALYLCNSASTTSSSLSPRPPANNSGSGNALPQSTCGPNDPTAGRTNSQTPLSYYPAHPRLLHLTGLRRSPDAHLIGYFRRRGSKTLPNGGYESLPREATGPAHRTRAMVEAPGYWRSGPGL